MKIYVGHSKKMDYEDKLYNVIRSSKELCSFDFILPHEEENAYKGREFYKTLDLFIAEVSFSGTGLGIELGWAYDDGIPIYYIYKEGMKVGNSLKCLSNQFYSYSDEESLVQAILMILEDWRKNDGNQKVL